MQRWISFLFSENFMKRKKALYTSFLQKMGVKGAESSARE